VRPAIPKHSWLKYLRSGHHGVLQQLGVESSAIHEYASALRIDSFPKPSIPIHKDRLNRQCAGFLKDIASAD
jgi:hypothetical protein